MKLLPQRIIDKIDMSGDGCWVWRGACHSGGCRLPYGKTYYEGRHRIVHRLLWELLVGSVPKGLQLDHLCRNPRCVRLSHLELVTPKVNTNRGRRYHSEKVACKNGHSFDLKNTRWTPDHTRVCRTCHRQRELLAYRTGARQ